MKNVCIVFSGGSYGTFIEWCLNYFSDLNFPTELPFTNLGNAHKFAGNQLLTIDNCMKYTKSLNDYPFVRFHPKTNKDEKILDHLKFVSEHFKKTIYMSPTKKTFAWSLNNKFEKIWGVEGWMRKNKDLIHNNVNRWGDFTSTEQMQPWQFREFLSFFIYDQHLDETEMNLTPKITNHISNIHIITLDNLKQNFKQTILDLLDYCQIAPVRIETLSYIYASWLEKQYHIFKDDTISKIISSLLDNKFYSWHGINLTIVDEALIQHFLRQQGIEIRCYNLNTFPTNTDDLKKLYANYLT
jgi:hypothetical protein